MGEEKQKALDSLRWLENKAGVIGSVQAGDLVREYVAALEEKCKWLEGGNKLLNDSLKSSRAPEVGDVGLKGEWWRSDVKPLTQSDLDRARREGFIEARKGMRMGDSTEAWKGYEEYERSLKDG